MSFHINAAKDDISDKILLPGDPLRAKWIAEEFLENAICYNSVRNTLGYTGYYKGVKVSVQSTGMGVPSCLIYVTELIREYRANTLIRIGTAGSLGKGPDYIPGLRDLVVVDSAYTDSAAVSRMVQDHYEFNPGLKIVTRPDEKLLKTALEILKFSESSESNKNVYRKGSVFTSDLFYTPVDESIYFQDAIEDNVLCIEMETAGLYAAADKYGAKALSIIFVSDMIFKNSSVESSEKESGLEQLVITALETLVRA